MVKNFIKLNYLPFTRMVFKTMDIDINPLSSSNLKDYLYFFDDIAFKDNPDWASCYCYFHHFPGTRDEWVETKKEENRRCVKRLILGDKLHGFLGYFNSKPIAWLNIDNRDNYFYLPIKKEDFPSKNGPIASAVCFLVSHEYRKKVLHDSCSNMPSMIFLHVVIQ